MWCNLLSTLFGGLLAGGGAILTQIVSLRMANDLTRRALAGAFAGEVAAICAITRRRKYLDFLNMSLDHVHQLQQPGRMMVPITQDYFQIYRSNAGALGLLPSTISERVALFYTLVKSLIEDMQPSAPIPSTPAAAEHAIKEQIALLKETLNLGDELVANLRKETKRSFVCKCVPKQELENEPEE